jgi:hypothetical protein
MNQAIEAWSKCLETAMGTDAFAEALGRYLDQWLQLEAPIRKALDRETDAALRALGLPSRAQVVSLASQVVALEERLEGLEDRLDELRTLVRDVRRAVGPREGITPPEAARPPEGA